MNERPSQLRICSLLISVFLLGVVASLAPGQQLQPPTHSAYEYAPTRPKRGRARPRTRQVARPERHVAAPSHRHSQARQALWHAQSARERQEFGLTSANLPERIAAAPIEPIADPNIDISPSGDMDYGVPGDGYWQGEMQYEYEGSYPGDGYHNGAYDRGYFDGYEGEACDGGYGSAYGEHYGDNAYGNCVDARDLPPKSLYAMGDLTGFVGVQGFTNSINEGASGSFGFHEGFNFGTALPFFPTSGWGFQVGYRATQNNLDGTSQTTERRNQGFTTLGVFRRSDFGIQTGLVVDFLKDRWISDTSLTQVRGLLSWKPNFAHEFGYWFAAGGDDATVTGLNGDFAVNVTDVQAFFYRAQSPNLPGASARVMLGFSNNSNALLAADTRFPLTSRLSLVSNGAYLIPDETRGSGAAEREEWNVSMSLVFSLRGSAVAARAPFTPMFRVADNGTFFVDAD